MKKLTFVLFAAFLFCACASANRDAVSPEDTSAGAPAIEKLINGEIARHHFASGITDREPHDMLSEATAGSQGSIYYFTEYIEMANSKVSHKWYINEGAVFEKTADITSPKYRYYTSINKVHLKSGDVVRVDVVDEKGKVIASDTIAIK